MTLIDAPPVNVFAAQPGLLVGEGAEMVPPVPELAVSAQQRWKCATKLLSAAGMLKLVVAVPSVDAPVHPSNA